MVKKLEKYNEKRDFEKTKEPPGKIDESNSQLRFVVQLHHARAKHYDFRLEYEGVLLSFAIPKGPSYNPRDKRLAVRVEDHPLDYRNFEGTIPKGQYGGGSVMLFDEGYWDPLGDVHEGLSNGELKFMLRGKRLIGNWVLIKLKSKASDSKENWLLIKEKDEYAKDTDGISDFTTSVRSGRTIKEIKEGLKVKTSKNPFSKAKIQLATLVDDFPKEDDFLYEVKYDGYRIIAYIEGSSVSLYTRNYNDYTSKFPSISQKLIEFARGRSMVFDGEVVVTDDVGKSNFQALQGYLKNHKSNAPTYIIFDLLVLDGKDLRTSPLIKRKEILEDLLKDAPPNLYYSKHIKGNARENFKAACESNLEGLIGKKSNSPYTGTRDGTWIKLKCDNREEFIIGGYTLTDKRSKGISALLLGAYEGDDFIYVGRAGTGISVDEMDNLLKKFKGLTRKKSYFKDPPKERSNEKITWLKPDLIAEIKFSEWTDEKLLRQASYKGLRIDKKSREVNMNKAKKDPEESNIKRELAVKISHPDKVLYEEDEITKLDIAEYYDEISKAMVPYLKNRILSVLRCPKGITQGCFFMKHPNTKNKNIGRINIDKDKEDSEDYFYIKNKIGLLYEVQMGTLEFHTWGSSVDDLERPDIIVFDLDPDEGMGLQRVREGVRHLKSILDELSLKSYLKTSGGKGYHIVIPIKANVNWDEVRLFSKNLAELMEQKWPDRYTSNMRKEKRKNKIFIDWIRNGRGATSIAPYSIRARRGAKVSMPISWEELDYIGPDDIGMKEAISRINEGDPWKDFFDIEQMLG